MSGWWRRPILGPGFVARGTNRPDTGLRRERSVRLAAPPDQPGHHEQERQRGEEPDQVPLPGDLVAGGHPGVLFGRGDGQAKLPGDRQEVANQLLGRLVAAVAILGHELGDDPGEFGRHGRIEAANLGWRLLLVLEQLLQHGPARERRLPREHLKQGAAQRVQITANIDVAGIAGLLGTDIIKCSQGHPALGQPVIGIALEPTGQAHIHELGSSLRREDDIRRLDIAVDDAARGCMDQGLGDLKRDVHRLTHGQRSVLVHPPPYRDAFDVFKGDIVIGAVLANAVHPRDILVVEPGRRPSLLIKPLHDLRITRLIEGQELERHVPIKLRVVSPEDRTHAPGSDRLFEQEGADQDARQRQGRRRGAGVCHGLQPPRGAAGRAHYRRRLR